MMIEINDQTTERLARQVAHETGESLTDAIRVSLGLPAKRNASMLASQVEEILARVEAMPTLDSRSADEILGYDG